MQSKTAKKDKHNRKTYKSYLFRVRRDSELLIYLKRQTAEGEYSLNLLITALLCDHFNCRLPHKEYTHRTIQQIY